MVLLSSAPREHTDRIRCVTAEQLQRHTAETLFDVAQFFGIRCNEAAVERWSQSSGGRHSKTNERYDAAAEAERQRQQSDRYADEIRFATDWLSQRAGEAGFPAQFLTDRGINPFQ